MNSSLRIESNWLGKNVGSELEKAFYADIGIAIGDDYLTRLEDLLASTVRDYFRGDAYQLALWFAANWWRLRWEPEVSDWSTNTEWKMAHSIASVGGGFVWPNVLLASDGDSIAIASRQSAMANATEPVRYLRQTIERVSSIEFEKSIDEFLEIVLSRMESLKIPDENLLALWKEVLAERLNPVMTQYRKLEAICGYDPDEAPNAMIQTILNSESKFGSSAIEEVAATGRHATIEKLELISNLAGGFRGNLPMLPNPPAPEPGERPWQSARRIARSAREAWGFNNKPISDSGLADLVNAKSTIFDVQPIDRIPMSLALKDDNDKIVDFYFESKWKTNNRFALARLIGDNLLKSSAEQLLPATKAKTARQQFQRAFSQEFLCPFDALMERINTDQPDEELIIEAAQYFEVSELVVRTTLVNRGELDRETLNAA